MKRVKEKNIIIISILLVLTFVFTAEGMNFTNNKKRTYNIFLITRCEKDESIEMLREGAEQAAGEFNANITVDVLSSEEGYKKQLEFLEKAKEEKCDAILISPNNYKKIKNKIKDINKDIPVVLLESGLQNEEKLCCVSSDNFDMGKKLAYEVLKNNVKNKKIIVLEDEKNCDVINERFKGFENVLKAAKQPYTTKKVPNEQIIDGFAFKRVFLSYDADIVVTFDSSILEKLAETKNEFTNKGFITKKVSLYGCGSTRSIIYYMENKIIDSTALQNEFNIGYIGVKNSIDLINKKSTPNSIMKINVIDNKNMYSKENQRLLFLFVR